LLGTSSDILFSKATLDQNASHARAFRRVEPWPVIAEVIDVRSVDDGCETPLTLLLFGDLVELGFAMKAAIRRVCDVPRPFDLTGRDELVPGTDLIGNRDGGFAFEWRKAGRHRRHAYCAIAEDAVGNSQDESAVYAP